MKIVALLIDGKQRGIVHLAELIKKNGKLYWAVFDSYTYRPTNDLGQDCVVSVKGRDSYYLGLERIYAYEYKEGDLR